MSSVKKTTIAKNKLVDKVRNILYKPRSGEGSSKCQPEEPTHGSLAEDVLWLKIRKAPTDELLVKWKNTYKLRKDAASATLSNFIHELPLLNEVHLAESLVSKPVISTYLFVIIKFLFQINIDFELSFPISSLHLYCLYD